MTSETETQGENAPEVEVVTANPAEPAADPRAVRKTGIAKPGKTIMVRRGNKPDAPALITSVDAKGLVTAAMVQANHAVVETVKHLAEIHPDDKLTGWYWPED